LDWLAFEMEMCTRQKGRMNRATWVYLHEVHCIER
jgi:hypothetical protein